MRQRRLRFPGGVRSSGIPDRNGHLIPFSNTIWSPPSRIFYFRCYNIPTRGSTWFPSPTPLNALQWIYTIHLSETRQGPWYELQVDSNLRSNNWSVHRTTWAQVIQAFCFRTPTADTAIIVILYVGEAHPRRRWGSVSVDNYYIRNPHFQCQKANRKYLRQRSFSLQLLWALPY